ncbi:AraC family transcriptional regulator [Paenibacillus sp. NFR01]|uniref:helix-turn-helix domain-containing protein n=1 Tax=Paenibacillus sp. NFR01 TaxID=1566279 RepID=UPI0008B83496|nr:AraC family transcriptional regulator [Paenibacillus sp. NFR01]SET21377.1 AraC-type DNA-binding protein [Paenibacillus sp. NFR01]
MDRINHQLLQLYLSNLQVNVTGIGFNRVWNDWRDIDYTPDYNKFYFICEGEGWLKIGDEDFYPKAGKWVMMPQGVTQSYSYTEGPTYLKYWCHFTAKIGQHNLFDMLRVPFFIHPDNYDQAAQLFQSLLDARDCGTVSAPLRIHAAMLELIAYYIEHAVSGEAKVEHSAASASLQDAITYIDEHVHRNITIQELAERVHLHPNYFIRLFKRQFGVTPIQFINKKRIEEAKWLLITTNLQLSEICDRIGIADVSYLSKQFKAFTGYSPSAYRLANRPSSLQG